MAVIPTGIVSLPLLYLRDTIKESANFQTLVGASDATDAENYIHYFSAEAGFSRPICVIGWEPGARLFSEYGGTRNFFSADGNVWILIQDTVDPDMSEADAVFTFTNAIGAILDDMIALSGQGEYLDFTEMETAEGPTRAHEDEADSNEDHFHVVYRIAWSGAAE